MNFNPQIGQASQQVMAPGVADGMPTTTGPATPSLAQTLNPLVNAQPVPGRPEMQILDPKPLTMQVTQVPTDGGTDASGQPLWRISGYREHDGVFVFLDTYDPLLADNHEIKKRCYDYRLLVGLGNAGIEPLGGHFRVTPQEQPASLLPLTGPDGREKTVWRRLFRLNSGI